jgi:hypothetical protein
MRAVGAQRSRQGGMKGVAMNRPVAILRKLLTMFIDDWKFALAILAWVFAYWLVVPSWVASPLWQAVILFAGLAGILANSVLHQARKP